MKLEFMGYDGQYPQLCSGHLKFRANVLLNDPETGELFYEILTYVNGDFVFGGHGCELFDFDAPFPGPELMRWEKIDV